MLGAGDEHKKKINFFCVWKIERNYAKISLYVCTQIHEFIYEYR